MTRLRQLGFAASLLPACTVGCSYEELEQGDAASADAASADANPSDASPSDADTPDAAFSCATTLACPPPAPGTVTVCGRLSDMGSGAVLADAAADGSACDPESPAGDGPCSLAVHPYSALPFLQNPTGTPGLPAGEILVDDCGRFRLVDVDEPQLGYLALVVDDAAAAADAHVPVARLFPASAGTTITGLTMPATTHATDVAWTTSAGSPFGGPTFAERGVFVPVFRHAGTPVAGVVVTENGANEPANTYYFTDASAQIRMAPDPAAGSAGASQDATGTNGAALKVNSMLVNHSGAGAEPTSCQWDSQLGMAVAGLVIYAELDAQVAGTGDPCP